MKSVSYRLLANSALLCSSLALTFVNADNLCAGIFDGTPFYMSEINSSGNDDDVVFKLLAILDFFFTILLSCFKNKIIYVALCSMYYMLMWLMMQWIESTSVGRLFWHSVVDCQNGFLAVFLIGQSAFLLLSGWFLFKYR